MLTIIYDSMTNIRTMYYHYLRWVCKLSVGYVYIPQIYPKTLCRLYQRSLMLTIIYDSKQPPRKEMKQVYIFITFNHCSACLHQRLCQKVFC